MKKNKTFSSSARISFPQSQVKEHLRHFFEVSISCVGLENDAFIRKNAILAQISEVFFRSGISP